MRIKVHNSMNKVSNRNKIRRFILNDVVVYLGKSSLCPNIIYIKHLINDSYYFLNFSTDEKEFFESLGFGSRKKCKDLNWWKDSSFKWKEIGK